MNYCGSVNGQRFLSWIRKFLFLSYFALNKSLFLPCRPQGEDSVEYYLGLTPSGVIVLRNKTTVAHYYWPRIGKVFYKGKYFMLRVCDKNVSTRRDCPAT